MQAIREASVLYEQRGPLVFSASLHLVLLVGAALWVLLDFEDEPEEFTFELVPPPAASAAAQQQAPTLEDIVYERPADEPLPTLDEIVLPERPKPVSRPVAPVVEQPMVVVEETPPPRMTAEEFRKLNPDFDKIKSQRTTPVPQKAPSLDFKPEITSVRIDRAELSELPTMDAAQLTERQEYIASLIAQLQRNVEEHSFSGKKLVALVACDILASGQITNIRILESSGDPGYDAKVKKAYERIGRFAKPPRGVPMMNLKIDFVQQTRG